MIAINSQEIRYFYRNIVKTGNVYRVKYNNKDYGEFSKLSDALYERDALFFCNFDYDLLVECDLENKYENMELPPFPEKRPKGRIKGSKNLTKPFCFFSFLSFFIIFYVGAYLQWAGSYLYHCAKSRDVCTRLATADIVAKSVAAAEIFEGRFAFSVSASEGVDSPTVVAAQTANELLNINGIMASFVFTQFGGKVYISARSIDELNVQVVMEKLGGGGHMSVAGAQFDDCDVPTAVERVKNVLRTMIVEGEIKL